MRLKILHASDSPKVGKNACIRENDKQLINGNKQAINETYVGTIIIIMIMVY